MLSHKTALLAGTIPCIFFHFFLLFCISQLVCEPAVLQPDFCVIQLNQLFYTLKSTLIGYFN